MAILIGGRSQNIFHPLKRGARKVLPCIQGGMAGNVWTCDLPMLYTLPVINDRSLIPARLAIKESKNIIVSTARDVVVRIKM